MNSDATDRQLLEQIKDAIRSQGVALCAHPNIDAVRHQVFSSGSRWHVLSHDRDRLLRDHSYRTLEAVALALKGCEVLAEEPVQAVNA